MEFRQTSDWDGSCGNYQIIRVWTVTDIGGNEIAHTQVVTVEDNAAPSFIGTLPGDETVAAGHIPDAPVIEAIDDCYSGQHIYMEMEPIDPSNASLILEGSLGDVSVVWTLEGVDVTQYKFRDVYTDNSLPTFSNGSFFTPSETGLDGAGFNAISGEATLRITFDQPVDNPILHINNIDISRWDFNPTTDHISLVSGNDQFDIVNGVVVDVDPATSGGLDSGLGSVMVHGTFSEILIDISLVDVTTDGIFLQMSIADEPIVQFNESSVPGLCPGDETITRTWTATDGCGWSTTHTQIITVEGIDPGPSIDQIDVSEDPVELGNAISVVGFYSDTCDIDDHQATWLWGDGNSSVGVVDQANNWVDGSYTYDSAGVYQVTLILSDIDGNSDTLTAATYVVIYDPEGGFVTGGGWIQSPPGAYVPDTTVTGKANFGFVSKYKNGASVPTGNTQFKFNAASFKFKSTSYEWLVISGSKAKYKGDGKVNNQGNYGFMLTGIDGDLNGSGGGVDKFRIKIWDKDQNDLVIYDNKMGSDDTGYDTQELGGGSITIHGSNGNGNGNNNSIAQIIDVERPGVSRDQIKVYPNPSHGRINVSLEDTWLNQASTLVVHDINGKLIHQIRNIRSIDVVLDIENEGVYFITISNRDERVTKKCVVVK
ncbi:MAG: T9SS type A sorting domain-containing protein [Saprospiraceae bacterium]|nr:T9SS type A sorting domain-containing protein [Saprospiraceae bacterium]